ncbi:MAG: Transcriptional regulator, TrmB [uncultured bacterium]|nr:MAG: Transcriptional regulator, TrmB [uncultured bacterium]KKQ44599.1 MAG: Transcriptional regulator, TrmB [Candidatus Moranbacteria bacterium GW2011_GWC2_37_8]KKQ63248.1 MAG: Transcriptional regulator, TrmB [Parcubacteria group bacterium GW2011_GWC1_38_22]
MQLEEVLIHLGLNEKQAKVYLAVLQLGKGSVPGISSKAGTKRPTTYLILEELRKRELVNLLPNKVKILYTAKSPEVLLEEQREKQHMIKQNMPELMAMFNEKMEKPKVTYYQGENNIVKLYDEIFKEREIMFYGSIASINPEVYKKVERYLDFVKKEKLNVREILQADEKSLEFKRQNESENHQIKIVSEKRLPTDNMIFGNKVAIITYKDEPMAVVIESSDVVDTYKSMFEMVWNSIS